MSWGPRTYITVPVGWVTSHNHSRKRGCFQVGVGRTFDGRYVVDANTRNEFPELFPEGQGPFTEVVLFPTDFDDEVAQ